MRTRRLKLVLTVAVTLLVLAPPAAHADAKAVIEAANRAVASGDVSSQRDLAPLVAALKQSQDPEELSQLVEAISDLGEADGSSPAAVKRYLLEQATPRLLELGKTGQTAFLKGDAIMALRDMGASRATLERAAAIAEADPDSYVQSRGEILRNYIKSMPAAATVSSIRPTDAAREQNGLAYLKAHGLGASPDQLRTSAQQGDVAAVKALLAAGVDVNGGGKLETSPLYSLAFSGCSAGGENDTLVETLQALIAGGANVTLTGDNGNTALISAAQMCGPRIVATLVAAGAPVNAHNGSGMTALSMALLMQKLDAAEVLVRKGARLNAQQAAMLQGAATNPRAKELIRKASGS
jgi:Ankyrin repeats (3 copies)